MKRKYTALSHSFAELEPMCFAMCHPDLVLHQYNEMFWDPHFSKHILQLDTTNTIKGFSVINEA